MATEGIKQSFVEFVAQLLLFRKNGQIAMVDGREDRSVDDVLKMVIPLSEWVVWMENQQILPTQSEVPTLTVDCDYNPVIHQSLEKSGLLGVERDAECEGSEEIMPIPIMRESEVQINCDVRINHVTVNFDILSDKSGKPDVSAKVKDNHPRKWVDGDRSKSPVIKAVKPSVSYGTYMLLPTAEKMRKPAETVSKSKKYFSRATFVTLYPEMILGEVGYANAFEPGMNRFYMRGGRLYEFHGLYIGEDGILYTIQNNMMTPALDSKGLIQNWVERPPEYNRELSSKQNTKRK